VRIREIMSSPAVVVPPELPVKDAAALLASHGFTCLPVVAGDGGLVGVVGEGELLADRFPPDPRLPLHERADRDPGDVVADVMVRDVLTANPQEGVGDLLTVLRSANIRSLPVVENSVVIGVITYRDLVRALARDDDVIEADVRRRLNLCGGVGRWQATVQDGEVTIVDKEGTDPSELNAAIRVAESVIGVTRCRVATTSTPGGRS
jgi:CBS domain-containing protein